MGDEAEQHEGSRWDLRIREGLVEPKHRRAMGEAIWLYLYLHAHAGFETGVMPRYRHDVASEALDIPLRTVKRYMERLEQAGYVVVTQSRYACRVEITRYKVTERAPGQPPGVPPMAPVPQSTSATVGTSHTDETVQECQNEHPGVPNPARGTNTNVFNIQNDDPTPSGVGAAPPITAPKQPKQARPARPPKPPSETTVVGEAWMRANKIDPKKAMGMTVPTYRAWAVQALKLWPSETILGCLSHMASKRHHDGAQFTITPTLLSQRIGEWEELPGKPTTYQEPSKPARSNGHRRPTDDERPLDDVPQRRVETCYCGAEIGGRRPHGPRCGLVGPVTHDNCSQPWRTQQPAGQGAPE